MNSKIADDLAFALTTVIPWELRDNLIGERIEGTSFFKLKEGDPTKGQCGYRLNSKGEKVYKIEHQPTGSRKRFRKINSLRFGECWEVIPNKDQGEK